MSELPAPLAATLDILTSATEGLQDPWWVFGGAAMILAGLKHLQAPDVDLMASPRDARRLITAMGGSVTDDPGEGLFRSEVFGQILTTPVPIDVMAAMDVRAGGDWTPVRFQTRVPVATTAGVIHIPSVREQIDTCRLFGRPKDLDRADQLERLLR